MHIYVQAGIYLYTHTHTHTDLHTHTYIHTPHLYIYKNAQNILISIHTNTGTHTPLPRRFTLRFQRHDHALGTIYLCHQRRFAGNKTLYACFQRCNCRLLPANCGVKRCNFRARVLCGLCHVTHVNESCRTFE